MNRYSRLRLTLFRATFGLACTALAWPLLAQTQAYPSKPIRIVIPFAAGSATDVIGRVFGDKISATLGQPVIVENKSGATGMIAADFVAKAPPDGYTLLIGTNTTNAVIQMLVKSVPYDPDRDFAPISFLGVLPQVVTVTNSFPAKSLAELISYARANPKKLSYAWANSAHRVSAETLAKMANIEIYNIPYKNASQAMTDLISGEVQMLISDMVVAMPHIKSGRIRALAVTSPGRSSLLPDTPTVAEAGQLPSYEILGLFALFAPAGTPQEVINKLNATVRKVSADSELRSRLVGLGLEVQPSSPTELGARMRLEKERWTKVAKEAGIEPQ